MKASQAKHTPEQRKLLRVKQAEEIRAKLIAQVKEKQAAQWVVKGDTAVATGKNGMQCVIDAVDVEIVRHLGLSFRKRRPGVTVNKPEAKPLSHYLIGVPPPGMSVKHLDGDMLNLRRANLEFRTQSFVGAAMKKQKGTTSRFKGVSFIYRDKVWRANVKYKGETRRLGTFLNEESAAQAYDAEAFRLWGDAALTNLKLGLFNKEKN